VNKHEVTCSLLIAQYCLSAILYTTLTADICSLIENLNRFSLAEAWIVLNLFLNLEKNKLRVIVKLIL